MAVTSLNNTIDIICGGGNLDLKIANPASMVDNGDGTYTFTQNDGQTVTFKGGDGYTVASIATGTETDIGGNPVPAGSQILTTYAPDGSPTGVVFIPTDAIVSVDTSSPCEHRFFRKDGSVAYVTNPEKSRYVSALNTQSNTSFVNLKTMAIGTTFFSPIVSQVITNPSACCSLIMKISPQAYQFMSGNSGSGSRNTVNADFSHYIDPGTGTLIPVVLGLSKSLSPSPFNNKNYDIGALQDMQSALIPPGGSITIRSQSGVSTTISAENKSEIDNWVSIEALSATNLNAVGNTICQ